MSRRKSIPPAPDRHHHGQRTRLVPRHSLGRTLRRRIAVAGLAAVATAGTVATGVAVQPAPVSLVVADAASPVDSTVLAELQAEREPNVSRSDRRTSVDRTKLALLSQETKSGGQLTRTKDLGSGDPRLIAQAMLAEFGFSADQFECLDSLWAKESGWSVSADNPTSSAYGIPQALPGDKMSSAGADWATNPATQIRWGLGYIRDVYGSPCSAWGHSQSSGWY